MNVDATHEQSTRKIESSKKYIDRGTVMILGHEMTFLGDDLIIQEPKFHIKIINGKPF